MAKDTYSVTGSGASSNEAETDLTRQKDALVIKLGAAKVSTNLPVESRHHSATFRLKDGAESEIRDFTCGSGVGWENIIKRAARTADDLTVYDGRYTVTEKYAIAATQKAVLFGERQPPAGREHQRLSSLEVIRRW